MAYLARPWNRFWTGKRFITIFENIPKKEEWGENKKDFGETTNWNRIATSAEVLFLVKLDIWDDKVFLRIFEQKYICQKSLSQFSACSHIFVDLFMCLKFNSFVPFIRSLALKDLAHTNSMLWKFHKSCHDISNLHSFAYINILHLRGCSQDALWRPILFAKKWGENI